MTITVGIDAISVYIPKLYVDLKGEWAQTRFARMGANSAQEFADKVIKGIGIEKMAFLDAHEDPATMAAMAVRNLIEKTGIDPSEICSLAVGTETAIDQSKSMSAYIIGMLEQYFDRKMSKCRSPQYTFACAGAMYAIESALNLFRSGENCGKYAVVVATDIARYELFSPGESTQGAGAVALLICKDPQIIAMDSKVTGIATCNERDFFRPNWRRTAVVDGKYSTKVYLSLMEEAFQNYCDRSEGHICNKGQELSSAINFLVCHVPFPKMAEYVGARFLPTILHNPKATIDILPRPASRLTEVEKMELEKTIRSSPQFKEIFKKYIEPSLHFSREVGNIYSGSLFLALSSLLHNVSEAELVNKRVLLCAYGSGATSIVTSGKILPTYKKVIENFDYQALFSPTRRIAISVSQYEYLHNLNDIVVTNGSVEINNARRSIHSPQNEFILEKFGEQEHNFGYRYYKTIS